MTEIERLVANAATYPDRYDAGRPARPRLGVAIVACMDARMALFGMLGLGIGDAHVIRNAGGAVTADVLRSLVVSQRRLGTREVMLVHHAGCGMQTLDEDAFKAEIEADVGIRPDWALESFTDVEAHMRESIQRVRGCPFLPHRDDVRGFVFDVNTGRLEEVVG
ncbi:MAG TPA: carbonic anhydrase [Mycobacteriales bacterium]|nr:carbonic anhydrase [Mycobacteriales bacterium]